jgi:hypothetical protein
MNKGKYLLNFMIRFFVYLIIITSIWLLFSKFYINLKVDIIRLITKAIYKANAPYINDIPFYQGLSTPIISFLALILATINKTNFRDVILNKRKFLIIILSIVFLFLLEIIGHILEIILTKSGINLILPYILITLIFSLGIVVIPIFLWLYIFDLKKDNLLTKD